MQNIISALEQFLPEMSTLFKSRYNLLHTIAEKEPIGRRGLALELDYSERIIRKEIEILALAGLVEISHLGIMITKEGEKILSTLYLPLQSLEEFSKLEKQIQSLLGLKQAIIVKGNVDVDEKIKQQLGMACASVLNALLTDDTTVAVAGGTTMSRMVEFMPKRHTSYRNLMVIPARGSVGERAEFQANTIAFELAKKLGAGYELLTIPDSLSNHSIKLIKNEPNIQKILQKTATTDIIVFGIGNAIKMAKRRNESQEVLNLLEKKQAVAETFRHYFDAKGQVVYATESIGVSPDLARVIPKRIAVAGGASKATAILAIRDLLKESYLVIDESAAREIIKKLTI